MNQKYKKLQEELQLMMNTMAANTFLLPSTWSDEQQSSSEDVRYKTYCNDRRDYVSIDVTVGKSVTIYLSGGIWDVTVAGRLFNMKSQSSQIMESMRTIRLVYNEIHSFNPNKTRLKQIRQDIALERKKIVEAKKDIARLRQEIKDADKTSRNQ